MAFTSSNSFLREASFIAKQRYVLVFFTIVFALSVFAVWSGLKETTAQTQTIERLLEKDQIDRANMLAKQKDYGGAAYYSFHLTYSSPSPLAFAAMGQRDIFPWKHRVRMLALEGQIYETDADNPELSFLGRFDFAFLVSVLLPLFVILLLHDLRASERNAGRYDLLVVTAKSQRHLWVTRALVLTTGLALAVLLPFLVSAFITQAALADTLLMALVVIAHLAFWLVLTYVVTGLKFNAKQSAARIASMLLAIWLVFTVLIPVGSDAAIDELVASPAGGEISLTQREAVNNAWDIPFEETWQPFLAEHPEWADKTQMESRFEWKWYYAFQQVGDQKAAALSQAYRAATEHKDTLADTVSFFSPPMLTQRLMSNIAETDTASSLAYEQRVRDYHAKLRQFYYPLLFNKVAFSQEVMTKLPQFTQVKSTEAKNTQVTDTEAANTNKVSSTQGQ
ncbi:DUF3526 domain-containing protein [Thalassotalea euphylliae]|uniref:DUF3526 domain-containing protein n=1 Tax=Thalassotalea euphylliae TaxID=1655234 RepID=A0A3E0TW80_9GAMM|nr:DUF3526 domain-containing protein [Thalassotalea euphylliae]REL28192.1 DUF3526 domain-containing protein [Thalassotalea euphylliae]